MLTPEGRTPDEVTAAAERTADLALKCARLTRERDRARDIAVKLEAEAAQFLTTLDWLGQRIPINSYEADVQAAYDRELRAVASIRAEGLHP